MPSQHPLVSHAIATSRGVACHRNIPWSHMLSKLSSAHLICSRDITSIAWCRMPARLIIHHCNPAWSLFPSRIEVPCLKRLTATGCFDLMHSGHYNALRQALERTTFTTQHSPYSVMLCSGPHHKTLHNPSSRHTPMAHPHNPPMSVASRLSGRHFYLSSLTLSQPRLVLRAPHLQHE